MALQPWSAPARGSSAGDPCRCPKGWETYSLCDAYGICVGNDQSSRLAKMCPPPSKTEPAVAQRGSGQTNDLFGELGNLLAAVRQQAVDMLSQDQCLRAKRAALEKDMVSGEYDRTFTCVCVPQVRIAAISFPQRRRDPQLTTGGERVQCG